MLLTETKGCAVLACFSQQDKLFPGNKNNILWQPCRGTNSKSSTLGLMRRHLKEGYCHTATTGDVRSKSLRFRLSLLLLSTAPLGFASASGESTSINTFAGGFATVDVTLQGNSMNNSTTIDMPRNVTIITSSFELSVDSNEDSPGQVWIDINEDGVFENSQELGMAI